MKKLLIILLLLICQKANAGLLQQYPVYPDMNPYSTHQIEVKVGDTKVNKYGESNVIMVDKKNGFYVDERNQIKEYERIAPPNPEYIPTTPHPTRTVEGFSSYYDRNIKGVRRKHYMTPEVPNYTRYYSNRRNKSYTKQEWLDVWCSGKQHYNGFDCVTENYAITFYRARDWALGVTVMPFRVHKAKSMGKSPAMFIAVDDLGLDAINMSDVKSFSELFNIKVFFGTIDSYIPNSRVTD